MSDVPPLVNELKAASAERGRDHKTRVILVMAVGTWLVAMLVLGGVTWNAYFKEKGKSQTLAQQVSDACEAGDLDEEERQDLCDNAEKVIENEDGLDGVDGKDGKDGADGADGLDGTDGVDGKNGRNGKNGKPGTDGADGPPGPRGSLGPAGPPGEDGTNGIDGEDGADGADGPPGVVNVETVDCEGPVIHSISASYNAETQTVTISCT